MASRRNIIVTGPTATGKTSLAVNLARSFDGEIISADSRQVYKGLDIGTGKDLSEYVSGGQPVRCHLLDIARPDEDYNLLRFLTDANLAIQQIHSRNRIPFVAGGTALYIDALLSAYQMPGGPPDGELRNSLRKLDTNALLELLEKENPPAFVQLRSGDNRARMIRVLERTRTAAICQAPPVEMPSSYLVLGVFFPREEVRVRIRRRLLDRLANGLVREVEALHAGGLPWERLEYFGLEYKYVAMHLQGRLGFDELTETLFIRICQFARRQDIWFRKIEREGHAIHWLPGGDFDKACHLVDLFLKGEALPEPQIKMTDVKYG